MLSKKDYYTLEEIADEWQWTIEDLIYNGEQGKLDVRKWNDKHNLTIADVIENANGHYEDGATIDFLEEMKRQGEEKKKEESRIPVDLFNP